MVGQATRSWKKTIETGMVRTGARAMMVAASLAPAVTVSDTRTSAVSLVELIWCSFYWILIAESS